MIGYDSDSQVSRIENGSRMPHLAEVLMIELVFGVPAVTIFPEIRRAVGAGVGRRIRDIMPEPEASDSAQPRVSYKAAQLRRVLASLRSHDEFDQGDACQWPTVR
jgi:hypothetical protein